MTMRKSIILLGIIVSFFASYVSVEAGLFVAKDAYNLEVNEAVKENLYVASEAISLQGKVSGDVFALGNSISVLGNVSGDLFLIGAELDVVFPTSGDIRVLGEHVFIASSTAGDVIAFGDTVEVVQGISVGGDVFVVAGKTNLQGVFKGDVSVQGDSVVLDGMFKGDVSVKARHILIKKGTIIDGTLNYYSTKPAVMEEEVNIKTINFVSFSTKHVTEGLALFATLFFVLKTLASLVAGILLLLLFRRFLEMCATEVTERTLASFGRGLMFTILVPVIVFALCAIVLGSLVGVSLLAVYVVSMLIAKILSPIVIGIWIFSLFNKDRAVIEYLSWKLVVAGALISSVLMFIPIVGWLVVGVSFFVSVGVLLQLFYQRIWLNR